MSTESGSEQTAAPSAEQTPQSGEETTPPWGEDFDPKKAWGTIQHLRRREKELEARPTLTDEDKAKLAAFDKQVKSSQTAEERLREEATRWQSEADTWRKAAVGSKIQALAAAEFADPSDAVAALADKNYMDASGQIDEKAITADLAGVLEAKPHYRKPTDNSPRLPAPNQSQGKGGNSTADPAQQFGAILQNALR